MTRLLIVTTVAVTVRSFFLPLARHFRDRGWQVDAMAADVLACRPCAAAFDRLWDVAWSRNPLAPANLLAAPSRIRRIVAEQGYDIVHVHTPVAAFVTRLALRDLRRRRSLRVVYTAHGFHFYRGAPAHRNAAFLAIEKLAGRWTDALVVVNGEDLQAARRHRLVPPERIALIPGAGVDLSRFSPELTSPAAAHATRAALGLTDGEHLYLTVGELIPRKRPADVVRAFAALSLPDAHLAIAGDGPLMPELAHLTADLGVRDRVHLLGYRGDVPALMGAADTLILASSQEGLPTVVIEAMSLGLPIIGTDIRGTRDLLADGAGRLVPVGDIPALAAAMRWMQDHPAEAAAMGRQGVAQAPDYDIARILRRHEDVYAKVLAS